MTNRAPSARGPKRTVATVASRAPARWILAPAALALVAAAASGCLSLLGDYDASTDQASSSASSSGMSTSTSSSTSSSGGGAGGGSGGSGGSTSGPGGAGGAGGAGGGAPLTCPGTSGPSMVLIPGPKDGEAYCVDSTEVTVNQYNLWLTNGADPAVDQPAYCSWNSTHDPKLDNECGGYNFNNLVNMSPDLPVGCVNWCDAYAYCAWSGKRLCGAIGGGSTKFAGASNEFTGQWFRACSGGGSTVYSYSNTYDNFTCVSVDSDGAGNYNPMTDHASPVPNLACEGGYPGLYDMSGNNYEWEDSCEGFTSESEKCYQRGGSFKRGNVGHRCDTLQPNNRNFVALDSGFRCCAEPSP